MSLLTDDCDMSNNRLDIYVGGNGDYYISVICDDVSYPVRISTSGGIAPIGVKLAVANLYKEMKKAGLTE